MVKPDDPLGVNEHIAAQLLDVTTWPAEAPAPGKKPQIGPAGGRSQDMPPAAALHPVGGIKTARLIDQQRPWQLSLAHVSFRNPSPLERHCHDTDPQRNQLSNMLSQLRQVLPARQSGEVPVEDQQQPVAGILFQLVQYPLRIFQGKRYGRAARSAPPTKVFHFRHLFS